MMCGLPPDSVAAAWLHDLVEDGGPNWDYDRLRVEGIPARTIGLVLLLTKWWNRGNSTIYKPDQNSYYLSILTDPDAVDLKLLDRADNLTEATLALRANEVPPRELKWVVSYFEHSTRDMAPLLSASKRPAVIYRYTAASSELAAVLKEGGLLS
jgi:hypothetical protein